MNDLLILIATIITAIGAAALVLAFSKVIIIALPGIILRTASSNSAQPAPGRQRSTEQNKTGSCPYC